MGGDVGCMRDINDGSLWRLLGYVDVSECYLKKGVRKPEGAEDVKALKSLYRCVNSVYLGREGLDFDLSRYVEGKMNCFDEEVGIINGMLNDNSRNDGTPVVNVSKNISTALDYLVEIEDELI